MLTTSERTTAQHILLTPHFVTSAYVLQHPLDKQPAASPELENQPQQINILLALTRQYGCTVETVCEGVL